MSDAVPEAKRSYPYVSANVWTELRLRFQKSIPSKITPGYLQTALGFESEKAAKNLLPQLRSLGLINVDGTPTDLAKSYRMDNEYEAATKEIVAAVYPEEVRELFPGPVEDTGLVAGWFMRHTGGGQASATMQARLYVSLVSGQVPSGDKAARTAKPTSSGDKRPAKRVPTAAALPAVIPETAAAAEKPGDEGGGQVALPENQIGQALPGLHIDVQIHIDAEATADQIDAVFASMAKHLYGRQ